ncbi:hypothetical protein FIBSPDRAFT_956241, partial [Athelia psychrophila]
MGRTSCAPIHGSQAAHLATIEAQKATLARVQRTVGMKYDKWVEGQEKRMHYKVEPFESTVYVMGQLSPYKKSYHTSIDPSVVNDLTSLHLEVYHLHQIQDLRAHPRFSVSTFPTSSTVDSRSSSADPNDSNPGPLDQQWVLQAKTVTRTPTIWYIGKRQYTHVRVIFTVKKPVIPRPSRHDLRPQHRINYSDTIRRKTTSRRHIKQEITSTSSLTTKARSQTLLQSPEPTTLSSNQQFACNNPMNPVLSQIDQQVLSDYVAAQVQAAVAAAHIQAQAPANDQAGVIAILQQLVQNGIDSNKTTQAQLEAQTIRDSNKPNRHEKIGTTPSKFKGERSDAERFLTGLEWYFDANANVYDTNEKVLALVYGLHEGKAGEWIQPYMRNTLDSKMHEAKKAKPHRGRTHHSRARSFDSYSSISDEDEDMEKTFLQDPDFLIIDFDAFVLKFKEAWYPTDPKADARNAIEKLSQGSLSV